MLLQTLYLILISNSKLHPFAKLGMINAINSTFKERYFSKGDNTLIITKRRFHKYWTASNICCHQLHDWCRQTICTYRNNISG